MSSNKTIHSILQRAIVTEDTILKRTITRWLSRSRMPTRLKFARLWKRCWASR